MDGPAPRPAPRPAGPFDAVLCETDFPMAEALAGGDVALAVIAGLRGPSYRRLGAAMAVDAEGRHWGSLSSGCLERDVIGHARAAIADGAALRLRYGEGSPFLDIALPCGGTLDIAIVPTPDRGVLAHAAAELAARRPASLVLTEAGRIAAAGPGLSLLLLPQMRFLVFGAGPEAATFARLARAAGYPVALSSPDADTLAEAGFGSGMTGPAWPEDLAVDPFTAVTLFFHDHERELALLRAALASPAFYVGAQGSLRAHRNRRAALLAEGLAEAQVDRLASPFGLIASTRDARTLAVSVLADVLARAPDGGRTEAAEAPGTAIPVVAQPKAAP